MRFLEILITTLILIVIVSRLVPNLKEKKAFTYISFAAGILIPVHLIVDGYRWHMIPIFIFTVGLILLSLIQFNRPVQKEFLIRNKITRNISNAFLLLIFVLSVILPFLLPVINLPKPGGLYAVGTTSFRMIDYDRKEIFTEDSKDFRNLLVTAWYPADIKKRMPVSSYWDEGGVTGKTYSINAGMGTFWYSHLSLVKTNSYTGAALSSDRKSYPVIIYSPSFYGLNTENTILIEELASQGYIVFSIAHTFETIVSVFPDGESVSGNLEYISEQFDSNADLEEQLYTDYANTSETDEKIEIVKQILVIDEMSTQLLKTRTEDAIFVLNQIEQLNFNEGIFKSKLDLNQIGIFGWSFGGAVAEDACIADNRFKAGINIDGWPYGELFNTDEAINQPFMIIRSDTEDEMEDIISNLVFEKNKNSAYLLSIENTWHMNFWDFPWFFKVYKYFGYWGPIDPLRLLEIERIYITGFFDKHLKGKDAEMLDESSDLFTELNIKVK